MARDDSKKELANFTSLQPSSGLNGRLGARVAVPYDSLANLHQQIGRVLQAVTKQRKATQ